MDLIDFKIFYVTIVMGKSSVLGIVDADKSVKAFERELLQVISLCIMSVCGYCKVGTGGLSSISIILYNSRAFCIAVNMCSLLIKMIPSIQLKCLPSYIAFPNFIMATFKG